MNAGITHQRHWAVYLAIAFMCLSPQSPADDLKLAVQPVFRPEIANQVYAGLVNYLNQNTEHQITLVTPKDFHQFWSDVRKRDDLDLIFADAHLTDFVIQRSGYAPMVKTAEPGTFVLLSTGEYADAGLSSLYGRRISTLPAPSLGYTVLTDWFQNPMQQPQIVSTATSWTDVVEIIFNYEADAAVAPQWINQRYPNLYAIATSPEFPGTAISASPKVSAQTRAQLSQTLIEMVESDAGFEALVEINISEFVPASADEYAGLESMLSDYYGY